MSKKNKTSFGKNYIDKLLKVVQKTERKLNIPRWYRGLSKSQVSAESNVTSSLRDDLEQGTCHRTKQCLIIMGLQPILPEKQIRQAMKISRGNDLAFIYLLLDTFYKTPESARTSDNGFMNYNPNEQILMTTIYHLDALITLRRLDEILPPGHDDIRLLEKRRKLAEEKERVKKLSLSKKSAKVTENSNAKCFPLPYFQNQPQPKHYGKSLYCPRPNYKIIFHFEDKLNKQNYTIPNEANRWFVKYKTQPIKRAAKAVVDECIGKLFRKHVHDLGCVYNYECEFYKVVFEVQNVLECRFNSILKDKCLNVLPYNDPEHQEKLEKLVTCLVEDITEYLNMYAAIRIKPEEYIVQLNNPNGTVVYFLTLSELKLYVETFRNLYHNKDTIMCAEETNELLKLIKKFPTVLSIKRDGSCALDLRKKKEPVQVYENTPTYRICECDVIKKESLETQQPKKKSSIVSGVEDNNGDGEQLPKESEVMVECVKSEDKFFVAPSAHKPFGFNFARILKYKNLEESETLKIKNIFLEALNETATLKYKFDNTLSDMPNLLDAVDKLATATFEEQARKYTRDTDAPHPISPLFQRTRFDCNDDKLMSTMLEQAFAYLQKDSKFVLVTFPNAHRLPIFIFYIKRRYGKAYSTKELCKLMHDSMRMFDGILRLFFNDYHLKLKGVPGISIEYNYKKCVLKKFQPIITQYQERLEFLILELARLFWMAASPSLGSYEKTRLPFYSYTPAKRADVKFFRVWKSREYRDMTYSSKRRMLAAKNAF